MYVYIDFLIILSFHQRYFQENATDENMQVSFVINEEFYSYVSHDDVVDVKLLPLRFF